MYEKHSSGLTGFCDLDYGGDLDARKSTLGFAFTLGRSVMSWQWSLQDVIALSTSEAEYIVVAESFKEAKWFKDLGCEMCNKVCSIRVYCDSQSAIHLAKNQNKFYRRSKHIDIKYNFIRDEVEHKRVD